MNEANVKLPIVYIGLEPDMFFEIADHLKYVLNIYEYEMTRHPEFKTDLHYQLKYQYLKSIIDRLEYQLTH